jgi:hypothetical protein
MQTAALLHMNFQYQTKTSDCFPICFSNAMLHLDIPMTPTLKKRLEVFQNGTENCTIYASEERLEHYERSIHKFIAEWNWALSRNNDTENIHLQSEEWAKYLLKQGVTIEVRNGPIEQKKRIIDALTNGKPVICEIWVPSKKILNFEGKHFILLIALANRRLLVHDPQFENQYIHFDKDNLEYKRNECGSNFEIDSEYFFSERIGSMKPKSNPHQSDIGYKFIILSKGGSGNSSEKHIS